MNRASVRFQGNRLTYFVDFNDDVVRELFASLLISKSYIVRWAGLFFLYILGRRNPIKLSGTYSDFIGLLLDK